MSYSAFFGQNVHHLADDPKHYLEKLICSKIYLLHIANTISHFSHKTSWWNKNTFEFRKGWEMSRCKYIFMESFRLISISISTYIHITPRLHQHQNMYTSPHQHQHQRHNMYISPHQHLHQYSRASDLDRVDWPLPNITTVQIRECRAMITIIWW